MTSNINLLVTVYVFLSGYSKRGIAQYRVYVQSNRPQNDNMINSLFENYLFDTSLVNGKKNMLNRLTKIQKFIIGLSVNGYKIAIEYNVCGASFQIIAN
jgi:hypothetical protein